MSNLAKRFVFISGLHRSGTSLLHEMLRDHPAVSGFRNTGVPEDEGQHLQNVYPPAKVFGGPGRFAFDRRAYMDENHRLANAVSAQTIFEQWSRHYDVSKPVYIEKSPPNIIRTRFLNALYPGSQFIFILRHPVAVAAATQKWSNTPIESLLDHSLTAYELMLGDLAHLPPSFVMRYEQFVAEPERYLQAIYRYLDLPYFSPTQEVLRDANEKYFTSWRTTLAQAPNPGLQHFADHLEKRALRCGYSFQDLNALPDMDWLNKI